MRGASVDRMNFGEKHSQKLEGTPNLRKKAGECYSPGPYDPFPLELPTTANGCFFLRPLVIDHRLAGVSRFY